MSNKVELLPCPFCGNPARLESNRDWHRIVVDHDERCAFLEPESVMVPATDDQLSMAITCWNRRTDLAQQPAPAVPDGWKLVPVRATREQVNAVCMHPDLARTLYRSMVEAAPAAPAPAAQEPAEVYAVRYLSNWDGEGDDVYVLAWKCNGELVTHESGVKISDLLEYQGDKILNVWPLYAAPPAAEQPYSTTSDKIRAELYDERPDTVKLRELIDLVMRCDITGGGVLAAQRAAHALLGKEGA